MLTPETSLHAFEARSLENPALLKFIAERSGGTPASWDCDALVWAGYFYHPSLDAARARLSAAEAAAQAAAEFPNPALGLKLGRNSASGIPSPWINSLQLDLPIETAGRRQHRAERAEQIAIAARLNLASVAWQIRGRVHRAWIDLLAAHGATALLREQVLLREEMLRLEEARLAAGDAAATEITVAQLALKASRLAWNEAARTAAGARIRLSDAIGIPDTALENARLSPDGLERRTEIDTSTTVRRRALLNRADLLAALAEYSAAHAALSIEVAKQFPEFRLGPGYTYDQGENKWSLGLAITLPVFDRNRGGIAEARARRDEAAAAFNTRQSGVLAEIERTTAEWQAAVRRRADVSLMSKEVERLETAARARFAAGDIPKSELVTIRLQVNAAALARLEALAQTQRALGDFEAAVQVPSSLPAEVWRTEPAR